MRRLGRAKPYKSKIPVICIGNFTMGGAGKTPSALYVAEILKQKGLTPAFLTRGYGGQIIGPHLVLPDQNTSEEVGDEPLLLARSAATVVSRNRAIGAQFIEALTDKPDIIIMDDGFQNPGLAKDLNIIVIDGATGVGNGKVFPSGPLRAPLSFQLKLADIIITIGGTPIHFADDKTPQYSANIVPDCSTEDLRDTPVIAYAGIARPSKFYRTLQDLGAIVQATHDFPDHHQFQEQDAVTLLNEAKTAAAQLITTEKDWVRLNSDEEPFAALKKHSRTIPIRLEFDATQKGQFFDLVWMYLSKETRGLQ